MRYSAVVGCMAVFSLTAMTPGWSHDYHSHDEQTEKDHSHEHDNDSARSGEPTEEIGLVKSAADAFRPFDGAIRIREGKDYLFIESNSIPQHNMMVGIRSWQQQVPLPQPYTGKNAWQIPLRPRLAKTPLSAKTNLFRGAIALAVNGVPIFNALNNRGEDAYLAGELDQWGGHCGRGDDYHYHIAPVHLEKTVGKGNPIAYALDGFPIFGYTNADGSAVGKLDDLNGQFDRDGNYHYHATKTYPYINGGLRGEVTVRKGQVDPQPRDSPVRPAGSPLRDAVITTFSRSGQEFKLGYQVSGRDASIQYTVVDDGRVDFTYVSLAGKTESVSYDRRSDGEILPMVDADAQPTTNDSATDDSATADSVTTLETVADSGFVVQSDAISNGGELPIEFTGDGEGVSPPISWTAGPEETKCYAVSLWHTPPEGEKKSYWLVYDIPADVTSLPRGSVEIGTMGLNDKDRREYDPMRSRGPGRKEYHITVYALSQIPDWPTEDVNLALFRSTIQQAVLAEDTLTFVYERQGASRWLPIAIIAGVLVLIGGIIWRRRGSARKTAE